MPSLVIYAGCECSDIQGKYINYVIFFCNDLYLYKTHESPKKVFFFFKFTSFIKVSKIN